MENKAVYIVTRYWDNDDEYLLSQEKPFATFEHLVDAKHFLMHLSDDDILGYESEYFYIKDRNETDPHMFFYYCEEKEEYSKQKAIALMQKYGVIPDEDNWKEWAIPDNRNIIFRIYRQEVR